MKSWGRSRTAAEWNRAKTDEVMGKEQECGRVAEYREE